jgi:segregation and condensation protein B
VEERVITEARRAVEAVVMAAVEPVEPQVLAQLVEIPVTEVEALCAELSEDYEREGRGFALVRVAGGYRFQTHPDMAAYVERFVLEGQTARLSAPALETLAIVAYKQPVSRAQLAAIRGVSVESTLSTLEQRGYVEEVGHDPGPGQAILYGTTQLFLERLGLDSLRDLPPLAEFVPEPSVVEALERGLLLRTEPDPEPSTGLDDDPDPALDAAGETIEVEAVVVEDVAVEVDAVVVEDVAVVVEDVAVEIEAVVVEAAEVEAVAVEEVAASEGVDQRSSARRDDPVDDWEAPEPPVLRGPFGEPAVANEDEVDLTEPEA